MPQPQEPALSRNLSLESDNPSPPYDLTILGASGFTGKYVCRKRSSQVPQLPGCDYLDICGEPEFMERMENSYHDQAVEKGCFSLWVRFGSG
ncbi:unnamed protein product [Linum trigynum]|uniref:Uncharacterized protein n=1 Tax=Linum trigynum TaxID=586398 RepID=A0AAV2CPK2_9ROSI